MSLYFLYTGQWVLSLMRFVRRPEELTYRVPPPAFRRRILPPTPDSPAVILVISAAALSGPRRKGLKGNFYAKEIFGAGLQWVCATVEGGH